jgi:MFS transporter, DHA2 family, multidrug resistance protein
MPEPRENQVNPWLIAASVVLPTFMEVMDTSIASVALPYIAGSMAVSANEATYVLTSYLAANAVILPASGWFSLRFGRKRYLLSCIILFTIASFFCGVSTSLGMIVISRAIQGAAGGALQPLSQAILLESFPPEKRGQAMAVFGLGVVVAPIIGPTLGGWITDNYSWRWAFYINIPIGVVAVMMISRLISDPSYIRNARVGRLDKVGLGLLAVGLGTLQIVMDKGQQYDWFGAKWIRWAAVVILVSLTAFVIREFLTRAPLVNLRIFSNRNFTFGCLLIGLFGAAIYGIVTLLPLFYQTLLGYTAGLAGIAVAPRGLGAVLIMPVVGVLSGKIDNRWLIALGFALFGVTSMIFGNLTLGISQWSLVWPIILSGVAAGMVFVPLTTAAMGTLSNEQIGNATGLYNLLRNIGGSIGISIVDTILQRHEQIRHNELTQFVTPATPHFRQLLEQAKNLARMRGDAGAALHQGYALVSQMLEQQAAILSYIDVFRYLGLMCFLCIPLVFLLKKVAGRHGAVAAH